MSHEQIAKDRLEKLKEHLCSRYFQDIDPQRVECYAEITPEDAPNRVYAYVCKNSSNSGYSIEAGLPSEILGDDVAFETLFTGCLAHELGHIVRKHPGSFRAGLATMLSILGREFKPLRKYGDKVLRGIEKEADREVRERGLGKVFDAGMVIGKRINGID